jgi:hypothetical protein
VSLNSSRASRAARFAFDTTGARSRGWTALVLVLGLILATAGCGMRVATNLPYTPAEGVNIDVNQSGNLQDAVSVRNLAILSRAPGQGILSGTLSANKSDALTAVTGTAIKVDGSNGSAITFALPGPITVANRQLVVLTDGPAITAQSADLAPGLEAVLVLQFQTAGQATIRVPVLDASVGPYASISPAASASPTPSA